MTQLTLSANEKVKLKEKLRQKLYQHNSLTSSIDTKRSSMTQSPSQRRVWLHDHILEGENAYHMPVAFSLKGAIDIGRLKKALRIMYQRHAALRTTFTHETAGYFQSIKKDVLSISEIDWRHLQGKELEKAHQRLVNEIRQHAFNLSQGPLFYVILCQIQEGYLMIWNMHHIVIDGVSVRIILDECFAYYRNPSVFEEEISHATGYLDYIDWFEHYQQSPQYQKSLHYWKDELFQLPPLHLPKEPRPHTAPKRSMKQTLMLSQEQVERVQNWCHTHDISLFVFYISLFKVLLASYTQQEDFAVGLVISDRPHFRFEKLVGNFINIILMRDPITKYNSFVELVEGLSLHLKMMIEHQSVPLEEALEGSKQSISHSLLGALFVMRHFALPDYGQSEFFVGYEDISHDAALADIVFGVTSTAKGWFLSIDHVLALFSPISAKSFLNEYHLLMNEVLENKNITVSELIKLVPLKHLCISLTDSRTENPSLKFIEHYFQQFAFKFDIRHSVSDQLSASISECIHFCIIEKDISMSGIEALNSALKCQSTIIVMLPYQNWENETESLTEAAHLMMLQNKRLVSAIILPADIHFLFSHNQQLSLNEKIAALFLRATLSLYGGTYQDIFIDCLFTKEDDLENDPTVYEAIKLLHTRGLKFYCLMDEKNKIPHCLKSLFTVFEQPNLFIAEINRLQALLITDSREKYESWRQEIRHSGLLYIDERGKKALELMVRHIAVWKPISSQPAISEQIAHYLSSHYFAKHHYKDMLLRYHDNLLLNNNNLSIADRRISPIPRHETDIQLIQIWKKVFEIDHVSIDQSWLNLGGHSLKAFNLLACIQDEFNQKLSLYELYELSTISQLSDRILKSNNVRNVDPIQPVGKKDQYPTTSAQKRLWFIQTLDPQNIAYNMATAFSIVGQLDRRALQQSFASVLEEQDVLRTYFCVEKAQVWQKIKPYESHLYQLEMQFCQASKLTTFIKTYVDQPFNLQSEGPHFRLLLINTKDQDHHVLVMVVHHILFDGLSFEILLKDLRQRYEYYRTGKSPEPRPHEGLRYVDFAVHQQQTEVLATHQLPYWEDLLLNSVPLELPFDLPSKAKTSYRGGRIQFVMNDWQVAKVNELCKLWSLTPASFFLSIFTLSLSRYQCESAP